MSGDEVGEARFVLRLGYSRNPVWWTLAILRVYFISAILVALTGCPVAAVITVATTAPEPGVVFELSAFVVLLLICVYLLTDVDHGRVAFYAHDVHVDWRPRRGAPLHGRVPYAAFSHVALLSPVQVELRFVLPGATEPRSIVLPIERLDGEDFFDALVEHLEGAGLDHVYSIEENGEVRQSRPWDFGGLEPAAPLVTTAWSQWRMTGLGHSIGVGRRAMHLYETSWARSVVRDRSDGRLVAVMDGSRLLDHRGCVLATVTRGEPERATLIESGSGVAVERRGGGDAIELLRVEDGAVVARGHEGARWELEFAAPTHELWATFLLLATMRVWYRIAVQRPRHPRHTTGYWVRPETAQGSGA